MSRDHREISLNTAAAAETICDENYFRLKIVMNRDHRGMYLNIAAAAGTIYDENYFRL